MDYEQKYKEALERAKAMIKVAANQDEAIGFANTIFPELKESEDEKIRKAIVATIHLYYGEPLEDEAKEMIAWLEKQGEQILANSAKTCKDEQKPTDKEMKTLLRTEYEKGRADAIAEMQNLAWSEEDDLILETIIDHIIPDKPFVANGFTDEELVTWLKSLRPQPKKEWSEEDESIALGIEQIVNCASLLNIAPDRLNKVRDLLKSLKSRVQPKQEWNEEDESYLNTTIAYLKDAKEFKKTAENCMDWLKSLKDRVQPRRRHTIFDEII